MNTEGIAGIRLLNDIGVGLSIDDFGTGHSSLSRLSLLPFDELKIDRSFVSALAGGGHETLISSIVKLAHELGIRVVAEGSETEEVTQRLRQLDCDLAQGFYLTKPLPATALDEWLDERTTSGLASAPRP